MSIMSAKVRNLFTSRGRDRKRNRHQLLSQYRVDALESRQLLATGADVLALITPPGSGDDRGKDYDDNDYNDKDHDGYDDKDRRKKASVDIDKYADRKYVSAIGETIYYTIKVKNTGNVKLKDVVVTDRVEDGPTRILTNYTGDTNGNGKLDPRETWVYTDSYTVTADDFRNGSHDRDWKIENKATVDTKKTKPESDREKVEIKKVFALDITKAASVPGGSASANETISYTIGVANTGNQTLTGVTVTDPFVSNLTRVTDTSGDNDALLEVGEIWAFTANHLVTQAEVDANTPIVNTATADSKQTGPDTASASVPIDYRPKVDLDKKANVDYVDEKGDKIKYTIKVTNTGTVTLTGVTVTDRVEDGPTRILTDYTGDNGNGTLDPGETWYFRDKYTVTKDDIKYGSHDRDWKIENKATVTTTQGANDSDKESVRIKKRNNDHDHDHNDHDKDDYKDKW